METAENRGFILVCRKQLHQRDARVWSAAPATADTRGEVPEWSIGTVSKTVVHASVPWGRIPPSPPLNLILSANPGGGASYPWGAALISEVMIREGCRQCGFLEAVVLFDETPGARNCTSVRAVSNWSTRGAGAFS